MSSQSSQHIILLLQLIPGDETSKVWSEYTCVSLACESKFLVLRKGLISMYEKRLKQINPGVRNIQYNVKDFNNYLDHMGDACALV